nr:hypothetical protein [uncultured Fusobacterium sp.]
MKLFEMDIRNFVEFGSSRLLSLKNVKKFGRINKSRKVKIKRLIQKIIVG